MSPSDGTMDAYGASVEFPDGDAADASTESNGYTESEDGALGSREPLRSGEPGRRSRSRSRPLRGHPWRMGALAVIVTGLLVLVGGYLWVQSEAEPSGPVGPQVIVAIPTGSGVKTTGSLLETRRIIGSALAYRIWSQINSLPGYVPGSYAFRENSSFAQVQSVLAGGPNVFPIDVPSGFTVSELARRVGQLPGHFANSFERVATSGAVRSKWQPTGVTSLEGLLGSGTYIVPPGETDRQLLQAMVDRFDARAARLGLASGAAALGYTPYQVVIIASIVEKEGVLVKNMAQVSRVISNRLERAMPLQMDSTVLYALGRDGGAVTSQDLRTVSPYNTYLNKGLPPTPTCFPSAAALEAALRPVPGSWLFFVVVEKDGTEAFSETYAGQLANEKLASQRGLG